jgi:hypothetical protein
MLQCFPSQIVWPWGDGQAPPYDLTFICSVDGTHCRIREDHKNPNSQLYSHKFKKPGFNYEVALDLVQSKIVWINGPFPAGQSDLHVFRKADGLKSKIPNGKKVIADNGYQGERPIISAPNDHDNADVKAFKRRARARQESINSKLKQFRILEERFRHCHGKHTFCFHAVAVIIQYEMDNGSNKLYEI